MTTGLWVLVIAVVGSLAFGGYRALTDGHFRGTRKLAAAAAGTAAATDDPGSDETPVDIAPEDTTWSHVIAALPEARLGERATLVQFSSAFCAPCRATRRVLTDVTSVVPGVEHLEVDAEHHLELVRRLDILRTPTTLVLDSSGRELTRATGAPRKEQVLSALASAPD